MTHRWQVDVTLKDVNGMETVLRVEVTGANAEQATETAKEAAMDEAEFTGAHVWMTARVEDEDVRLLE